MSVCMYVCMRLAYANLEAEYNALIADSQPEYRYICMHVCMHVCMRLAYANLEAEYNALIGDSQPEYRYVCMYVCMYACMRFAYAIYYVYIHTFIHTYK